MTNSELLRRIERLERLANKSVETEDLRAVEISIYGEEALSKLFAVEGRQSLADLAGDPQISGLVKKQIIEYLQKFTTKKGEKHDESSNQERN